jgi:hypothetical protein
MPERQSRLLNSEKERKNENSNKLSNCNLNPTSAKCKNFDPHEKCYIRKYVTNVSIQWELRNRHAEGYFPYI